MGYKLFKAGIWGNAGDMDAQYKDAKIVIRKAAPGTFFALFGSFIVSFTLWKGLEFNKIKSSHFPKSSSVTQVSPDSSVEENELPVIEDSLIKASTAESRSQHIQNYTPQEVQDVVFVEDDFGGQGTGVPSDLENDFLQTGIAQFNVSGSGPASAMLTDSNFNLGSTIDSDSIQLLISDSISGAPD